MSLTAAVIAGGYSRRMGRDKAWLPYPVHGTLLQRQLSLIAGLRPAQILVSCRPDQSLPVAAGISCIHDTGTHGPLGGLHALVQAMRGDMLLVLAVDLGRMSTSCLEHLQLLAADGTGRGVVPRTPAGLEPLAAIYPRGVAELLARRLEAGADLSVTGFVRAGMDSGLLGVYDVPPEEIACFANWNSPADLLDRPPE